MTVAFFSRQFFKLLSVVFCFTIQSAWSSQASNNSKQPCSTKVEARSPQSATPTALTSKFGHRSFTEFKAGSLPILLSVPHDGRSTPQDIPDRKCPKCLTFRDATTLDIALMVARRFEEVYHCPVSLAVNHLHRRKMDANREIGEAALKQVEAEKAWNDFHQFIDHWKVHSEQNFGQGIIIDFHAQRHPIQRIELGYALGRKSLSLPTDELNREEVIKQSSIRALVHRSTNRALSELLTSEFSLGAMLEKSGYAAIPSPTFYAPNKGEPFFSGGYITKRHGSRSGGNIDAIQLELNYDNVRDSKESREAFAQKFTDVLLRYFQIHYMGPAHIRKICPQAPF